MVLHLRMVRLAGLSRDRAFPSSVGWATLLAPVFMYWILVHVTGIPPLEPQMLHSRGERYRDYQSRTSMFFPLAPQKGVVT
jgi:steroid 5-alpha reductase family enzyme